MLKYNILNQHAFFIPNKEIQYLEMNEELIKIANNLASEMGGFAKPAL